MRKKLISTYIKEDDDAIFNLKKIKERVDLLATSHVNAAQKPYLPQPVQILQRCEISETLLSLNAGDTPMRGMEKPEAGA